MTSLFLASAVVLAQEGSDPGGDPARKPGGEPPASDAASAELLNKALERLASAKSLSVKATMTVGTPQGKGEFTYDAMMKGEGVRVAMDGKFGDAGAKQTMVCDGKKVVMKGDRGSGEMAAAEKFGEKFRKVMGMAGVMPAMEGLTNPGAGFNVDALEVVAVKPEGEEAVGEKKAKVLSYAVAMKGTPVKMDVKVWVSEETLEILKREMKDPMGHTTTEVYLDWGVDKAVDDASFKLDGK
jgi:outer membrane lipoprotein-sorting protein